MTTPKTHFVLVVLSLAMASNLLVTTGCNGSDDNGSDSDTDTVTDTGIDTDSEYTCDPFEITVSLSSAIGSVAIVEWSAGDTDIESAYIEFGLDETYGKQAPVDLDETNYRTLLLGMKALTQYHFRIVVNTGDAPVESCDCTLTTGPELNGLPTYNVATYEPEQIDGGYTISTIFMTCEIFILDGDGNYVWWYQANMTKCSRARLSYDGKHMLVRNVNVGGPGGGTTTQGELLKISMDGMSQETFDLSDSHHDFTVLPDNGIAYIDYDGQDCDDIMEMDAAGNITTAFHISDEITPSATGGDDGCHTNSINYWPEDDSYTMSVLNKNLFLKVSRSGNLQWIFGGDENQFTGSDTNWHRQHGHHFYDGKLLFFNNGDEMLGDSNALIYDLDEDNLTASLSWEYSHGNSSMTLGDAQHLPNGNTLVTYSNEGIIDEVASDGTVVQQIYWNLGGGLGYTMRRSSLYGPPSK